MGVSWRWHLAHHFYVKSAALFSRWNWSMEFTLLNSAQTHFIPDSCELSDWNPWKNKNVTHELLQNLWALIYWRSSGTRKKNQSTICNTFMCIKSSEKPMFHQLKTLLNEGWNINMDPARIRGHLINPSLYIILSNSSGGWVKGLIDHDGDFPRQNSL